MDYYSYFCRKVVVLFRSICLQYWYSAVTSGEYSNISESDQRDFSGDYTRFAIISEPKIQITQNKNPVEANYIAHHIIVNFLQNWHTAFSEKMLPLMMHFYWHTLYIRPWEVLLKTMDLRARWLQLCYFYGRPKGPKGNINSKGYITPEGQTHIRNGINTANAISNSKGVLHAKRCQKHKMV